MSIEAVFNTIREKNGFEIEKNRLPYKTVFSLPVRKCARYLKKRRADVIAGNSPVNDTINSAIVDRPPAAYLSEELRKKNNLTGFSEQDVPARLMSLQATAILNFPFMRHVIKTFKGLPGYRLQRLIIIALLWLCAKACPKKIVLGHKTNDEIRLARTAFASDIGRFSLYDVLGEAYPVYHAEMTRRIPAYVAHNADALIRDGIKGKLGFGSSLLVWGKTKQRFLGLYPVIEVPESELGPDASWVSQDNLGRREICKKVFEDAKAALTKNPDQPVYVIDYGGGVGNLSEILLKRIYGIEDDKTRRLLADNVRVIVRDASAQQISGGIKRFENMAKDENGSDVDLSGIRSNILFLTSDITAPMTGDNPLLHNGKPPIDAICAKWPDFDKSNGYVIGMCAYVLGAIPSSLMKKTAREISRQCNRFYGVDFSSPMWRKNAFLADTGEWGRSYLRAMHGKTDGILDAMTHPHAKLMTLSPGLASQYASWPGADGHCGGYTIDEDGMLIPPNIQVVAENINSLNGKKV
ncbi:MAG: hypothetical protein GXP53_07505, partial [Deltaproteobacteria bacterium]|nr:hypothetical protein [Deltaproteobacteria bacterium]